MAVILKIKHLSSAQELCFLCIINKALKSDLCLFKGGSFFEVQVLL